MLYSTRAYDIAGRASAGLPVTRPNRGVGRPYGARRAVAERVTAPTMDWDGFDKAIVDAAVLHVPVALG